MQWNDSPLEIYWPEANNHRPGTPCTYRPQWDKKPRPKIIFEFEDELYGTGFLFQFGMLFKPLKLYVFILFINKKTLVF